MGPCTKITSPQIARKEVKRAGRLGEDIITKMVRHMIDRVQPPMRSIEMSGNRTSVSHWVLVATSIVNHPPTWQLFGETRVQSLQLLYRRKGGTHVPHAHEADRGPKSRSMLHQHHLRIRSRRKGCKNVILIVEEDARRSVEGLLFRLLECEDSVDQSKDRADPVWFAGAHSF